MRFRGTAGVCAIVVAMCGCESAGTEAYEGTWQYDRQSLRELALASAYESVTMDGEMPLTPEERADLERWVNEQHDQWDKWLELRADGRYIARSRISDGKPEEIAGTWSLSGDAILLVEESGATMATGHLEGDRLVLVMTDDEGTVGRMVMLPSDETN